MFIELTNYNTGKKILINNFDRIITVLDTENGGRIIKLETDNVVTVRETIEEIKKKIDSAEEIARMFNIPVSLRSQNPIPNFPMKHNELVSWTKYLSEQYKLIQL